MASRPTTERVSDQLRNVRAGLLHQHPRHAQAPVYTEAIHRVEIHDRLVAALVTIATKHNIEHRVQCDLIVSGVRYKCSCDVWEIEMEIDKLLDECEGEGDGDAV